MTAEEIRRFIELQQETYRGHTPLEIAWLTVYTFCDKLGMNYEGEQGALELVLNFINKTKEV